jgi:hypothetical protein
MTPMEPPRTARWLLTHFGSNNAALIGDLDERYRYQPSAIWATIALLIGSVIGVPISRWHQPHHIPVVLLFVATHVAWICGSLAMWNLMHGYASFRGALPCTVRIIGWECVFISAVVWAGILHVPYETGSEQPPATL